MKAGITKEQAYNAFLRGHNGLTLDDNTSCALAAHSLGKRSALARMDEVISVLQSLGFVFDGGAKVTTIQAYNWLRKYYADSVTTVDIIKTARGKLALHVATWEVDGDAVPYLYCQTSEEHELVLHLLTNRFPRCDHAAILAQMAKEPTEVV